MVLHESISEALAKCREQIQQGKAAEMMIFDKRVKIITGVANRNEKGAKHTTFNVFLHPFGMISLNESIGEGVVPSTRKDIQYPARQFSSLLDNLNRQAMGNGIPVRNFQRQDTICVQGLIL